jgi:very-short-patch-repair endonuclease
MNVAGWSVGRFWSTDVFKDRAAQLETIVAILEGRMTEDVRAVDITFKPAKVR